VVLVIILLAVGVLLIAAEMVLPGIIAGVIGGCCLLAGMIEGYVEFGAHTGNLILIGVLGGLLAALAVWLKFFPDSRLGRLLVSRRVVGEIGTDRPELLGKTGTAFTQLRPAGTALIDGKRLDVVTEGQLVEKGQAVRVVGAEGMKIIVRAI
jgi:membrane-bound serine protease (ClpP class)